MAERRLGGKAYACTSRQQPEFPSKGEIVGWCWLVAVVVIGCVLVVPVSQPGQVEPVLSGSNYPMHMVTGFNKFDDVPTKPPFDPKHPIKLITPSDVLRKRVPLRSYFKNFNLKKGTIKRITEHARGPLLMHLMRVLTERQLKRQRHREKWNFTKVFDEHITMRLHFRERKNKTLIAKLKKKVKDEYFHFRFKKMIFWEHK